MIADDLKPLARPIDTLALLPGNPRRGDVAAVRKSYETFGQRKPIVALRDGTVIAGNHQLMAALELGWTEIAVVYVDDDDTTAKAFALADNRISDLGTYDDFDLIDLLKEVAVSPDLLDVTGYKEHDLADLLARYEAPDLLGLEDKYGEAKDLGPEVRPVIKVAVSEEAFHRWNDWVAKCADDAETAFTKLMDKAKV